MISCAAGNLQGQPSTGRRLARTTRKGALGRLVSTVGDRGVSPRRPAPGDSRPCSIFDLRYCRVCGCSDSRACVTDRGPCWWVAEDLCSACQSIQSPARDLDPRVQDGSPGSCPVGKPASCRAGAAPSNVRHASRPARPQPSNRGLFMPLISLRPGPASGLACRTPSSAAPVCSSVLVAGAADP